MTSSLSSKIGGIRWLFFLQIGSRIISFILNTLIARKVPQSTYAISNVHLQLLLNIILPFTREAFRRACLRLSIEKDQPNYANRLQKMINLSILTAPLGLVISLVSTYIFIQTSSQEELSLHQYTFTMTLVGIAAAVELLSEPLFILVQHMLLFNVRAIVELLAIALKSLVLFVMVNMNYDMVSFGAAQVVYSLTILAAYWVYYFTSLSELNLSSSRTSNEAIPHEVTMFPRRIQRSDQKGLESWSTSFHLELIPMIMTFKWQAIQKALLQDGEKVLLRTMETVSNQSVFAIVNVLGSLFVRFTFQWLEEGMFPIFSKMNAKAMEMEEGTEKGKTMEELGHGLCLLTKLVVYVGCFVVTFLPPFSFLLLEILYSTKYSSTQAPEFLSWYAAYIMTLGVNGITEAFAHSAAPPRILILFNFAMVIQSGLFVGLTIFFLKSGIAAGMILANIVVTVSRIVISVVFIRSYFKKHTGHPGFSLLAILPHPLVILAFAMAFIVTSWSSQAHCASPEQMSLFSCATHIGIGGICGVAVLAMAWAFDGRSFRQLGKLVSNR